MRISIAGIGASAGGLEAFQVLLSHLPVKTGVAFVFVLDVDSVSLNALPATLAGVNTIPIRQAEDGMAIEADHVYILPPEAALEIVNENFQIASRPPMPIDHVFRSIAQGYGSRAIGVILSGGGTDGAAGLKDLKVAGGVTFAQDPATAKCDSMPLAAICTGCVDFLLSPQYIATELTALASVRQILQYAVSESGAGAAVSENFDVLEVIGDTTPYLVLPAGNAPGGLLNLIPEMRLLLEVEKLLREVKESGEPARQERIPLHNNGVTKGVSLEVRPFSARTPGGLLVLFEPVSTMPDIESVLLSDPKDEEIARLRQDLADSRHRLLSTIEDRRSANEARAEADDLAALIVETTAAPLLVLDSDLRIVTANPSFLRAFNVTPHEAQGQQLFSLSHGAWDVPHLREKLARILPEHRVVDDFVIEQNFPEIGRRVLVLTARQLDGLQKILLGIDDITARREREHLLRESEERFRRMADTAPVLIWLSGPDRACTFVNKPWLDFTGRTMQQELGTGWAEGVHPDDLRRCLEIYTTSFDARRSFQMDYRLRRWDGEYRWVVDNGVPFFDKRGTLAGYIGSCADITDVKIIQEQDFAKQKLETVGALAAGIAHDFNNLLGGILAHAELALTGLTTGAGPIEELERIRAASIRGAEIVRQLMIYAGQESESLELVDVASVVEDMLHLLRVSVSKHVKLETDFDENILLLRASPTQIRQIAMNLITNASEAIGDRDGVIRVTTRRVTVDADSHRTGTERLAEGEYLQLEVTDTGRGMRPEVQARVFDPFFTTKPTGSHGQGLVVVQRIVRSLYGGIRILSAPGKGSTFRILLPLEQNTVRGNRPINSPAKEEKFLYREATILVVDDEDLLRQAVSKMLRKKGLTVLEASEGTAALDLIRAQSPHIDVLLLDVTLPGASSREVYQEAKHLRPGMPVIITSAKSEEMAAASLSMNVEHFLRKPFRRADLFNTLRGVLPC